jgi:endonuclease YncB( thermonuclease family)
VIRRPFPCKLRLPTIKSGGAEPRRNAIGRQYRYHDAADKRQSDRLLADKLGERTVHCSEKDVDRYGRTVAVCFVGGEDINRWMTFQGWALAYRKYSRDYVDAEDEARATGRGLWRGAFEPPWDWRKEHPRGGATRR